MSEKNMSGEISLKSVRGLLGAGIRFRVPYYQRGYRWKREQVQQLIGDLQEFKKTEKHPFYFLQALVVAKNDDHTYSVVDGQQRLTTLQLMLDQVNAEKNIPLDYDRLSDQAMDRFYKSQAREAIRRVSADSSLEEKILDCKFLWYEVSQEAGLDAFAKLNSGKIPVRDSELVKCVMLSPGSDESGEVTQARAQEWDAMERMMRKDDVFAFMTPRGTWREEDRMTVLLRYAGYQPTEDSPEIFPFLIEVQADLKTRSRVTVWKKICAVYYRLTAWFEDPLWYHAFGWFTHMRTRPWTMAITLPTYARQENDNDYEKHYGEVRQWLFLHNVAYCWQRGQRYSFVRHRAVNLWSVEHIFARNQRDLTKEEFQKWLGNSAEDSWTAYQDACRKNGGSQWLAEKLQAKYPPENEDHSLANLALLPQDANASFNNSLFEGKRDVVVAGTYWIPPATEAVFLKALPGLSMTAPYWSKDDKRAYVEAMSGTIEAFKNAFSGKEEH